MTKEQMQEAVWKSACAKVDDRIRVFKQEVRSAIEKLCAGRGIGGADCYSDGRKGAYWGGDFGARCLEPLIAKLISGEWGKAGNRHEWPNWPRELWDDEAKRTWDEVLSTMDALQKTLLSAGPSGENPMSEPPPNASKEKP